MITLTNGKVEQSFSTGYAWFLFFFGPFGMLYYREYKLSAIFFVVEWILFHMPDTVLLYNVPCIIFAYFFHNMRIRKYLRNGWYAASHNDENALEQLGFASHRHFF